MGGWIVSSKRRKASPEQSNGSQTETAGYVGDFLAAFEPRPLEWLWEGLIPCGKLTVLAGHPGVGKSSVALDLACRLSGGDALPGTTVRRAALTTVLLALEDDPHDTLRPRGDALGGDINRIYLWRGVKRDGREQWPQLDRDLTTVEQVLKDKDAGLLIIDPINGYMGKVDGHVDIDVRNVLQPLAKIAQDTGAAVLVLMHVKKDEDNAALLRVSGSTGYVGVACSVLGVGIDPNDLQQRALLQLKNNLSDLTPGIGFCLDDGALEWSDEPVSVTPEDIFKAAAPAAQSQDDSQLGNAVRWLRERLADGPMPQSVLIGERETAGVAWRTVERAKAHMGVESHKVQDGNVMHWVWALPEAHRGNGRE